MPPAVAWHKRFEDGIRNFTPTDTTSRKVLEAIADILGEWEAHHDNEAIWAHPEYGLLFTYISCLGNKAPSGNEAAARLVEYYESLVLATLIGDYLLQNEILDEENAELHELSLGPFMRFNYRNWSACMGGSFRTPNGPWDGETEYHACSQQWKDQARAGELKSGTPVEFLNSPMWYRYKTVRDRMLDCDFWKILGHEERILNTKLEEYGLAKRLFWFVVEAIVACEQGQKQVTEEVLLQLPENIVEQRLGFAWSYATEALRTYSGSDRRMPVPRETLALEARITAIQREVHSRIVDGRWRHDVGALEAFFGINVLGDPRFGSR